MARTFASSFRDFMFSARMAQTSAGFAIGTATAEVARAITFSLLIPCIQMASGGLFAHRSTAHERVNVALVLEYLLYWLCVIFVAYLLAEVFFSRVMLGVDNSALDAEDASALQQSEQRARQDMATMVRSAKTMLGGAPGADPASSKYAAAV